jgi:hypothetical protein
MLGEVVTDEHVKQVGVAAQVRLGQCDQLSVPGRGREPGGSGQELRVAGQQRGGHQERGRGGVRGTREDLGRRVGMVSDQAVKEGGDVVGHTCTVDLIADGTLTATDLTSVWPSLGRCSLSVF